MLNHRRAKVLVWTNTINYMQVELSFVCPSVEDIASYQFGILSIDTQAGILKMQSPGKQVKVYFHTSPEAVLNTFS